MSFLCARQEQLSLIFQRMNYRNLGKIDAMELLSVIILAVDGDFKQFVSNVIYVFGFQNG